MSGERAELERRLSAYRAPAEREAGARGLEVARAALREHAGEPAPEPARRRRRLAAIALAAIAVAGLALSPAGATVRDLIEDAVTVERVRTPPLRLPAPGTIVTSAGDRAAAVSADGSIRSLGPYRQAELSPLGLNVAVTDGRRLEALNAAGELQWTIVRRGRVRDPAWAPSGLRIAYLAGSRLRVVEGDGSPDRSLAGPVAAVAPRWRPQLDGEPPRDLLAFVDARGQVRIRDAAGGDEGLTVRSAIRPRSLAWLADGRLAVAGGRRIELFDGDGRSLGSRDLGPGATVRELASSPRRPLLAAAIERGGTRAPATRVELIDPGAGLRRTEVWSSQGRAAGLAFSPDGGTLALGWPQTDSWIFARVRGDRVGRVRGEADVGDRLAPALGASPAFPAILEWGRLNGTG